MFASTVSVLNNIQRTMNDRTRNNIQSRIKAKKLTMETASLVSNQANGHPCNMAAVDPLVAVAERTVYWIVSGMNAPVIAVSRATKYVSAVIRRLTTSAVTIAFGLKITFIFHPLFLFLIPLEYSS